MPVGVHGYVGYEGWEKAQASDDTDIESGQVVRPVVHSEGVTGAGGLNGGGLNGGGLNGGGQTQYYQPQHDAVGRRV